MKRASPLTAMVAAETPSCKYSKLDASVASVDDSNAPSNGCICDDSAPLDPTFVPKQLTLAHENMRKLSATSLQTAHEKQTSDGSASQRSSRTSERRHESKVLVIYTGGTIGMKMTDGVYVPSNHYLASAIRNLPPLNDNEYVDENFASLEVRPYCLPVVRGFGERRVVYWLYEYSPLLDSSDMTFDDWITIANDIKKSYASYDGFVILHGTDTLSYTASALSFMLENLGKAVVITGAQIPVAEVRSDGRENLAGAIITAGYLDIPEVCVYFNNKVLRGNRTVKQDSNSLDAFATPNMHPLAHMNISIRVNYESVYRSNEIAALTVHDRLCRQCGVLRIFPSIPIESVRAILGEPMKGVVLETYGAGNVPIKRDDIITEIRAAVGRGCMVLNVSQCARGHVSNAASYATGKILTDAGVISGSDMTVEAALTKLAYVLTKDCDLDTKRMMLQANLRGELTVSQPEKLNELDIIPRLAKYLHTTSQYETRLLKQALFPPLVAHAAKNNDTALLKSLHISSANLSNTDYSSRTPLAIAAAAGNLEATRYLLSHGVSVHVRDSENENALQAAIRSRNLDVIAELRAAGAHLIAPSTRIGTELGMAASEQDLSALRAWQAASASLDSADYCGRTALLVAVERGADSIVEWLCANGADPTCVDNLGRTPVSASASSSDRIRVAISNAERARERRSSSSSPALAPLKKA